MQIGGVDVKINPFDVSLVFGIINGDMPINLSYAQKMDTSFVQRRFVEDSEIKISKIKRAVIEACWEKQKKILRI